MEKQKMQTEEVRVKCVGNCFQQVDGAEKRCASYGRHEWCENYWVKLSCGTPEFFEEEKQ